jgi:hypothetical protein
MIVNAGTCTLTRFPAWDFLCGIPIEVVGKQNRGPDSDPHRVIDGREKS